MSQTFIYSWVARVPFHNGRVIARSIERSLAYLRNLRNDVRIMRMFSPLDSLFPRIRQVLLAATLLHPERWWYLSDLALHLNVTPSSRQREVAALTRVGILEARRDGNRIYYRPDANCPFLGDLQALFVKTTGLAAVLRETLEPYYNQLEYAFVYGSMARGEYTSESDIDLMLIGTLYLADVSLALRKVERTLNRPINATLYAFSEFAVKLAEGNHFVRTVMQVDKIYLKGNDCDLATTLARQKSENPCNEQERVG